MAGDRYSIKSQNDMHFSTFTVINWMDVFIRDVYRNIIVDSLNYCVKEKGLEIYAWCLMTSHMHLIARANEGYSLSDIYRDLKKHTSKQIVEAIKNNPESRREWMLDFIAYAGKLDSRKIGNKFWKEDNHNIILLPMSTIIFEQKLDYVHNNPVDAGFVDEPHYWKYSSACDYAGIKGLVNITLN
ncbi:MAG: transposase [Chitinophagales bacterium]|nr:transposase [Chitinophagales bacterium]